MTLPRVILGTCILVVVLLCSIAIVVRIALADMRQHRQAGTLPTVDSFTRLDLQGADGINLACWYQPSRNGAAIVLLHGYGGSRADIAAEAKLLAQHKFGVLLCDSRAHGESEGERISWGNKESPDLSHLITWLAAQPGTDPRRIGGFGFSFGGMVLSLAAATDSRIRSLVLVGTPSCLFDVNEDKWRRWALPRLAAYIKHLTLLANGITGDRAGTQSVIASIAPRPIHFIHGAKDLAIPLKRLEQNYSAAGQPKSRLILPKAGHGDYFQTEPELYANSLLEFYTRTLTATKDD